MSCAASRLAGLLLALSLAGCSEPDRVVSSETDDGRFELTMEARKNSLRTGETLLVKVTVESLQGQLASSLRDTVNFFANAGSVQPNRLIFTFVGVDDSLATGGVTVTYTDWITFSLDSRASADRQGELMAQYRDLQAVLKIRILQD